MANPYKGDFSDWSDVVDAFDNKSMQEPEEVLLARYDNESYDGYAIVIYRQGNRVFEVTGSHCSCYGLEGQWTPEEYDIPTYIAVLRRRGASDEDNAMMLAKLDPFANG